MSHVDLPIWGNLDKFSDDPQHSNALCVDVANEHDRRRRDHVRPHEWRRDVAHRARCRRPRATAPPRLALIVPLVLLTRTFIIIIIIIIVVVVVVG
jgi:hypothetical protein